VEITLTAADGRVEWHRLDPKRPHLLVHGDDDVEIEPQPDHWHVFGAGRTFDVACFVGRAACRQGDE